MEKGSDNLRPADVLVRGIENSPLAVDFGGGPKRNIGKTRNRIRITEEDQEQKAANKGSKPSNQEQPKALP